MLLLIFFYTHRRFVPQINTQNDLSLAFLLTFSCLHAATNLSIDFHKLSCIFKNSSLITQSRQCLPSLRQFHKRLNNKEKNSGNNCSGGLVSPGFWQVILHSPSTCISDMRHLSGVDQDVVPLKQQFLQLSKICAS